MLRAYLFFIYGTYSLTHRHRNTHTLIDTHVHRLKHTHTSTQSYTCTHTHTQTCTQTYKNTHTHSKTQIYIQKLTHNAGTNNLRKYFSIQYWSQILLEILDEQTNMVKNH